MHSNLNILLLEDNELDKSSIVELLHELGYMNIYDGSTSQEGTDILEQNEIDVAIIDIALEGSELDGISFGEQISSKWNIPILFTSSSSNASTINRLKNLPDCEYVVKHVSKKQLFVSLHKLLIKYLIDDNEKENVYLKDASFFLVKSSKKHYQRVNKNDLLYLEAEKGGTNIFTKQGKLFVYHSMVHILKEFSSLGLLRNHHSFAFAFEALESISDEEVTLSNGKTLPIGRSFRKKLKERLNALKL